jgi:hypothetical protein
MCQHACKVDSSPSLNELSERVRGDPSEKDSRYCAADPPEDFRIVKRSAIPGRSGQEVDCGMAHAQWQAAVRRLRLLVEHADEFTPSVFVKKVDESLRELRKAAMRTISDEKEE